MVSKAYISDCLRPYLFGLIAYRFRNKEKRVEGYYSTSKKYGYKKLVGNIFILDLRHK